LLHWRSGLTISLLLLSASLRLQRFNLGSTWPDSPQYKPQNGHASSHCFTERSEIQKRRTKSAGKTKQPGLCLPPVLGALSNLTPQLFISQRFFVNPRTVFFGWEPLEGLGCGGQPRARPPSHLRACGTVDLPGKIQI